MKIHRLSDTATVNVLLTGFCLAVFFIDILTPLGAIEWVFYIGPIFAAGRRSRPAMVAGLTIFASVLILLGYYYSPPGGIESSLALVNRLAVMGVLWLMAAALVLNARSREALSKAENEVEAKTRQTAELEKDKAGLISEIEARKLIERQRSDFFSMVTHDLKSPLNVITGYADMLLEERSRLLAGDSVEIVKGIRKSSEKLLEMVDTFLDVSRLETGALAMVRLPEDPAALIGDVAAAMRPLADRKGILLVAVPAEGLPRVMMDRKYVERAVANLVTNAINYTPGSGKVVLDAAVNGGFLEISVSDTGPGIPVEEQQKVFEKFYRARGSAGCKGSGLGLVIVKGVAEAHGGRVELESALGAGSTFSVLIPVS